MIEKRCETCDKDGCGIEHYCTRHEWNNHIINKDVSPRSVGVREPADYWSEGTSIENIMYRIREIEKKLEGV
jgi:hypothetical protein